MPDEEQLTNSLATLHDVRFTRLAGDLAETNQDDLDEQGTPVKNKNNTDYYLDDNYRDDVKTIREEQRWALEVDVNPKYLDVTLGITSDTGLAKFVVRVLGHYHYGGNMESEPEEREALDFAESVAYPELIPFVREAASDLARRLRTVAPRISAGRSRKLRDAIENHNIT